MPKASKPGDWIFDQLPKEMTERQLKDWFNIFWRVALMWIPPRDERFDYIREMGSGQIDAVLNNEPLKMSATTSNGGQHIIFIFPERHMTTQEEYVFADCLVKHHQIVDAPLTIIDMVTKSPLLIGSLLADDIRIIKDTKDFDMGLSNAHRAAKFKERRRAG